jgi:hypothetical protein
VSEDDFRRVLRDCDHPVNNMANDDLCRSLDPKGFWRVDKEKPPELRQTVLSLVAFRNLQAMGLDRFLDEWELPTRLRLADYDLGRDDRAQVEQPVTAVLGPRLLEWQKAQSAAESWEECARHAELLEKIVPTASADNGPEEPPSDEDAQIELDYTE